IDLATGMNAQILLSSKYWRIDFITSMGFVLISVPLNIFLIKKYGLIGSAYANLISVFIYNTTRLLIIWKLFKLQPYNHKNLLTMVIAAVCFFIVYISPSLNNIYADAILKTVVFMPLYIFLILKLKISEDFNQLLLSFIEKIKIRTKK
ncbi:MAG TPA: polysaccharide biosynthesis C-terminal domain-containing protein, partial [Chitinophagaceae bacterium]|nr:polysaccharide biosynthesis C-terminal domain-containing protein [Chitinophagaceae bacterium]